VEVRLPGQARREEEYSRRIKCEFVSQTLKRNALVDGEAGAQEQISPVGGRASTSCSRKTHVMEMIFIYSSILRDFTK
jgi:hypothetical protein